MKKLLSFIVILLLGVVLIACEGTKVPEDIHQQVFDNIEIGYDTGDSSSHVTKNIELPVDAAYPTTYLRTEWNTANRQGWFNFFATEPIE